VAGSVRLDKTGKPTLFVVTDNFIHDAKSSAEDNGMPGLRMVTVPAREYYKRRISREEVKPVAVGAIDAIIDALTRPLTSEEANPKSKQVQMVQTIEITAESYDLALEKFNQLFLDNHWGSGLPLVPPTPERVKWMLTGTIRSPQEVIGTVAPKKGVATIEKIAINAVMAGAKPEYLPVIIAAMEAITDKNYDLLHVMASTGSFTLLIQVNGPIAREINMNSGIGFLGYGWRANDTIGYAVRLSLINLGHLWPAENDMALIGRPSSHTFYTFAENEENSPWEPYHVSFGYKPEDSCVTVSTINTYTSLGSMTVFGGGAVTPWTPQSILDNIVKSMSRDRAFMTIWKRGTAISSPSRHTLLLHPEFAMELNRRGFTRKSLQKYLYERTSILYEELSPKEIQAVQRRIEAGEIPQDRIPAFKEALKPGGKVPLLERQEDIHIIVAGGIPGYTFGTFYFSTPPYNTTSLQTKLIRGATLTQVGR
jgi:hypothetical protein